MKVARWVALALLLFSLAVAAGIGAISQGWFGRDEVQGVIAGKAVPRGEIARRTATVREAALARGVAEPKQVLFGDLHVHTTFSVDAFLMSLPIAGGSGAHPPADACDFARYCSALDFWSINDHAENLSPRMWSETVAAVRQCNAIAGDAESPDLVTYLGWEWSQIGFTPDTHYGHKNVVLRDLADDAITARPIGARAPFSDRRRFFSPFTEIAISLLNGRRGLDFARFLAEVQSLTSCPEGVPVRDLPSDCQELTATPADLFAKLREWDVPAIVIPHGNTWGIYTPPGASFRKQLAGNDPDLQRLVEVYSGHGNAEEYRDWRATVIGADGSASCPAPGGGFRPSCWRAGALIRERCLAEGSAEEACDARAAVARQNYVDAGIAGWRTVPGQPASAWLDSGQCRDCFLPAFNYRPASSVQAMLAYRSFDPAGRPRRFRFGLIGSSDIHTARPGTGYKEFGRGAMTEGGSRRPGREPPAFLLGTGEATSSVSVPLDLDDNPYRGLQLFEGERATAFFNTGGLVAVHAPGRDRNAIFAALENREAYATSGPRILLWFDLLGDAGGPGVPMGAATVRVAPPHFRVRAVGSFEQKPGCPEIAGRALGAERLAELCLGECYHPSDERRLITRIEIVRIRPQVADDEPLTGLVEDPWRSFDCPPDPAGCGVEFDDPDFASASRDAVYYARAIEAPSLAIHGDPLNCTVDAAGECVKVELCDLHTSYQNDCLGEVEERAWSSPIFVDYGGVPAPSSYAAVNPENARPPFDPRR